MINNGDDAVMNVKKSHGFFIDEKKLFRKAAEAEKKNSG